MKLRRDAKSADGKIEYVSLLNAISAISVVMLHTNGCFWDFSREIYWITANIIESVLYFAVPVFFMISGAILLDYKKRYDTKTFFSKRIKKTVIPLFKDEFQIDYSTKSFKFEYELSHIDELYFWKFLIGLIKVLCKKITLSYGACGVFSFI